MEEYDLYINMKKPGLGVYVPKGAALSDFADKEDWVFDGTSTQAELPRGIVEGVAANGHAFRQMD